MIKAHYFSGESTHRQAVEIRVQGSKWVLVFPEYERVFDKDQLVINVEAEGYIRIDLKDGSLAHLSVFDPDSVAQVLAETRIPSFEAFYRKKAIGVYAFAFLGLGLVLMLLAPVLGRSLGRWIPDSIGKMLVSSFARDLKEEACDAPEILGTVKRYAAWLLPKNAGIEVVVHGSGVVNAYALPGMMVINFGLIRESESPEELIGIMAHEAGHLYHKHSAQSLVGRVLLSGLATSLESFSRLLPLSVVNQNTTELERDADAFAVDRLDSLGVSRSGMIGFFERTMKRKGGFSGSVLESLLSDHPLDSDRIRRFRETPASGVSGDLEVEAWLVKDRKNWEGIRSRCFQ